VSDTAGPTQQIQSLVDRLNAGDDTARAELIQCACSRLMNLTRTIKQGFDQVNRWEQTDDLFQRSAMRLYQSLAKIQPADARHFFRLAAVQIRRELIDLARHYGGPQGMGANLATQHGGPGGGQNWQPEQAAERTSLDPKKLCEWGEFHEQIEKLPNEEREAAELLFYNGLSQEEAAEVMGVSVRTLKRYWRAAKLKLHELFDGRFPGSQ
jgi:RNA polymerase sigma-70 factor (ECF subfamily)